LNAIARGPFIADWELPIRTNVDRARYREIVDSWPHLEDWDSSDVYHAINGALNECCHAYEMERSPWGLWFTISRDHLLHVYDQWREVHEETDTVES
jgi:hypothetical protein